MKTSTTWGTGLESRREFAQRLRKLLAQRNMNQAELARVAGISKDAISTYMMLRSLPSRETLVRLANVLEVDPDDLLIHPTQAGQSTPFRLQLSVSAAFARAAI